MGHTTGRGHPLMVDYRLDQMAIWRKIKMDTVDEVACILNEIFLEWNFVDELLMDNGITFHLEMQKEMLNKWTMYCFFRAAYRPSRNGMVERHHCTIKTMVERGCISPLEVLFWYNVSSQGVHATQSNLWV